MATQAIADWVNGLSVSQIPDQVNLAALRSFYNYVGCAIGGSEQEATRIVRRAAEEFPAAPGALCATILSSKGIVPRLMQVDAVTGSLVPVHRKSVGGSGPEYGKRRYVLAKADPFNAALINGVASHIDDYDDTHLDTIIHPTGAVASALLAWCEYSSQSKSPRLPISGKQFLCCLIAGIEVECILGLAVWPSHYDTGWHITATTGSIGAAVAVGKAMGLEPVKLRNAIGIASSLQAGMRQHFGSHSKPLGVGYAAQTGLKAAHWASLGMSAAADALEGDRGWIACVCPEQRQAFDKLDRLVETLRSGKGVDGDGKWEIEKNTFKPFPCGIVIHPVIDGCIQLRNEGADFHTIDKVDLWVHPLVLELTGKTNPQTGLEGKFSVYHGAACGLMFGKATPEEYEDAVVQQTAELRKKTHAIVDHSIRAEECHIILHEKGKRWEKHVTHAVGSLQVPLTDLQINQKFLNQVVPVLGQVEATGLSERLRSMEDWDDIAEVIVEKRA